MARELPPNGLFVWDTTGLPNGSRVWLRAELESADESIVHAPSQPFVLANGQSPALHLTMADDAAGPLAPREVCWQTSFVQRSATVRLLASPDGGANWTSLAEGLPVVGCQAT